MLEPFITIEELSAFLGRDVSTDATALLAIDSACQAIRGYTQRTINQVEELDRFVDGTGTHALLLPEWPVVEIVEVQIRGESLPVDEEEYYPHEAGMLIRRDYVWPRGNGNIEVTYTHGWVGGSGEMRIPPDIRMVALRCAQRLYAIRGEEVGDLKQETIGDYSYTIGDSLSAEEAAQQFLTAAEKRALDPYKKP